MKRIGNLHPGSDRRLHNMRVTFLSAVLWPKTASLILLALLTGTAGAQAVFTGKLDDSPLSLGSVSAGAVAASPIAAKTLPEAPSDHRFWDGKNRALLATVAALSATDFVVTRANLQNGGRELNPVTRVFSGSTAGLAVNFVGESAGIIGLSYYFHRTGHHRLERLIPMLNIGVSSLAVVYDLSHR